MNGDNVVLSDIEIAQASKMHRIIPLAHERLGIGDEHLSPYGHYKAKLSLEYIESLKARPDGKLILVTAISPTPGRSRRWAVSRGVGSTTT